MGRSQEEDLVTQQKVYDAANAAAQEWGKQLATQNNPAQSTSQASLSLVDKVKNEVKKIFTSTPKT
jgi:hypothetical protein